MENKIETNVIKPNLSIFVNEQDYRLITVDSEVTLDKNIEAMENLMANNDGKGKSDEEKDNLYGHAQVLWNEYKENFTNVDYTFYLNRKEYNFLFNLLTKKLEYDVNTVFFAIELTNMLNEWKNKSNGYKNDTDVIGFEADATEITYMYHLIATYKVTGLDSNAYQFASILRVIGTVSKVINYYDNHAKAIATDIQNWVAAFEDGVTVENTKSTKSIKKEKKEKNQTA